MADRDEAWRALVESALAVVYNHFERYEASFENCAFALFKLKQTCKYAKRMGTRMEETLGKRQCQSAPNGGSCTAYDKYRRWVRRGAIMAAEPETPGAALAVRGLLGSSEITLQWVATHFGAPAAPSSIEFVRVLVRSQLMETARAAYLAQNICRDATNVPFGETLLFALQRSRHFDRRCMRSRAWYVAHLRRSDLYRGLQLANLVNDAVDAGWYTDHLPSDDLLAALKEAGLLNGCSRAWLVDKMPRRHLFEALREANQLSADVGVEWYMQNLPSSDVVAALELSGLLVKLDWRWIVKHMPKSLRADALIKSKNAAKLTPDEIVATLAKKEDRFEVLWAGKHLESMQDEEWLAANLGVTGLFRALLIADLLRPDSSISVDWCRRNLSCNDRTTACYMMCKFADS